MVTRSYIKSCGLEPSILIDGQVLDSIMEENPDSLAIFEQSTHLPSSTHLTKEQMDFIANKVKSFISL